MTETLANGLLLGGLYALFGLGLSLCFGVMRVAQLAHGDLAIAGAFAALALSDHLPLWVVLALVPVLAFGLGWALQRWLLDRVMGDPMRPMLVSFGLSVVVQTLLEQAFGPGARGLQTQASTAAVSLGGLSLGLVPLATLGLAVGLFAATWGLLHHSDRGRVIRATAENARAVALFGADAGRVRSWVMGLSVALAAVAGIALALRGAVTPFAGGERLLIAFQVAVIGGMGRLWANFAGALALGLIHAVSFRLDPGAGLLYGHLLLVAVLLLRPEGAPR
ncbi:branched-chain amino acid ABC transporter permease [Rhodobacter sp. KR11]|uniref:branched-chain amino acid ABC transporter permease n=1 Tax=Rhodobacter sp. KR11 TaxID=2974588 RepID=UPI002223E945|nr:branched-chain amino acid ABC transporter permease [Rhodobacter sp. KR11]MCW1917500.1 branched-chain amino acid ABC transporter permease [Rhodobacter sp. KR11]